MSQTAPYRHFDSKNALFVAIATYGFQLLTEAISLPTQSAGVSADEVLIQQGLAYMRWAEENPEKYQLFFDASLGGYSVDPILQMVGVESFQVLLNTIEAGIKQGIFIDKPVVELGGFVWSFVHGTASLLIGAGEFDSRTERPDLVIDAIASVEANRESNLRLIVSALMK